jgi:hypothetical protein
MRIRQHVAFVVSSTTITAASVATRVGLAPDAATVRGAKRAAPPAPIQHSWRLECREPGRTIDEQIGLVLARVRPIAGRLRELLNNTDAAATLQVVRYFNDDEGEEEILSVTEAPDGTLLTKLPGQHQLLGWHLEPEALDLLCSLRVSLDVDEYD